jgi:Ca2+-binding RTX toxin-like protein
MGIFTSLGELFGYTPYGEENPTTTVYGRDGVDENLYGVANSLSADYIYGFGGDDYINAYQGNDVIDGGSGHDVIRCGAGMDLMTGGADTDTFRFSPGDSGLGYNQADVIWDFNREDDWISFDNIYGTANTYVEYSFQSDGTYEGAYNQALSYAQQDIGGGIFTAFYTDGWDGYLFADSDLDGHVDTGIELRGLTSVDQFNYYDMI